MPREALTQIIGSLKSWTVNAKANGKPAANLFTSADPLDAKVYAGDGIATTLVPNVAWATDPTTGASLAPQGTVTLSITPAMFAALSPPMQPGSYKVEIGVTPVSDGQRRILFYSGIRFLGTSGAGSLPPSLCTMTDMLNYSSDVGKLLHLDEDETGFAGQRNRAMGLFAQEVIRRYAPRLGGSRRMLNEDGTGPGPFLKLSPSPDGSPAPDRPRVATWILTPGRLVVNEDIVEANARMAAALVYGSSPGSQNPYQQMADKERALSRAATQRAVIEIDTKDAPDGSPTIRIDRDVVYLT